MGAPAREAGVERDHRLSQAKVEENVLDNVDDK